MPGILPMKVIKVGSSSPARIAQACDRCRSKKIRCDGIRPCCSQCANVGFECKTSDKLSRRAFPRGYTESLEERVRLLENEVRELKELLDAKDEKLDLVSRLHSQSNHAMQLPSPRQSTASAEGKSANGSTPEGDEVVKVSQSPCLLEAGGSDSYFAGTSSTTAFVEAFRRKVQEHGRSADDIDAGMLLARGTEKVTTAAAAAAMTESAAATPLNETEVENEANLTKTPPRLISDQLVNVFFQEWAPLFPVLHRPAFLDLYEKFVADVDSVTDKTELAQLNLVFGVASLSMGNRSHADVGSFETQWKAAIDTILKDNTMPALQALVLAQIFCALQGDSSALLTYKALATTLSSRLGLHQSQEQFALGSLTCEMRKKVFWTLYTVDCFTAVTLGLPKHIKDKDVHCEYPVDADDENVTERGFNPTPPDESTKLSSALALYRAARILSKILEDVFPAKASYELSLKRLAELSDELDGWKTSLPPHLRLSFVLDKPSTGTVSSRSPLLSLTYHYIRALIQRPVITASTGQRPSSSMITLAASCKHMVQVIQLLDERGMSFAFCLNRDEVLVLSGLGLLFEGLSLDPTSKLLKDNNKMIAAVMDILETSGAPCSDEFGRVASAFLPARPKKEKKATKNKVAGLSRHNSDTSVPSKIVSTSSSPARKPARVAPSRFSVSALGDSGPSGPDICDYRRATVHNISLHPPGAPSQSPPSLQPPTFNTSASSSRSEPARSPDNLPKLSLPGSKGTSASSSQPKSTTQKPPEHTLNLDYLSFGNDNSECEQPSPKTTAPSKPIKAETPPTDWEKLLGSLDNGATNIFDATYGGRPVDALRDVPALPGSSVRCGSLVNHDATLSQASPLAASDIAWHAADLWKASQCDTLSISHSALATASGSGGRVGHAPSALSRSSDEPGRSAANEAFAFASMDWGSSLASIDATPSKIYPASVISNSSSTASSAASPPPSSFHMATATPTPAPGKPSTAAEAYRALVMTETGSPSAVMGAAGDDMNLVDGSGWDAVLSL